MRTVETTGKTIEEAKELAAQELGVPVERIEFDVIDEGGKGFLGMSRGARVKGTVIEEGSAPGDEAIPKEETVEAAGPVEGVEAVTERPPDLGGQTPGEWTLRMVTDVLNAANLTAAAELRSETDEEVDIDITGPDVAILIGKHGQTLDALQYLLDVALNRAGDSRTRVLLDAEGYRDRHAQMITAKAIEYAKRVKESGEEAVLDPQPARDRRIVHMALADDAEVYTYSEGEGYDRHVVISPRK